jgi:hypothetical protein
MEHDFDDPPPPDKDYWWFLNHWGEEIMRYARFFGIIS